ncbi:MAG TPA: SAM-dependent methyltransferase [Kofleriaceae bacterium]
MKDDTSSRTAAFVAAARQLGQLLPESVRLVDDPYGAAFVSPAVARWFGEKIDRLRPLATAPGITQWILYMQVRTRVIDDALRDFLAGGGRQLVLLGAGFDCRALRLPELAGVRVLEVDHPATQARKRSVLDQIGARSSADYVTWDFEARAMEDLPDILDEAGLDLAAPVFTIWEGVTMYLTEPAIDASLRAIRAWSAAGSQLALTYFAKSRIDAPSLITRAIKAVVATFGEPWKFGWHPDELPAYLAERKLQLVRDIAMADAARELLPPDLAAHVANPDRRFALAAAPESIAVAT